MAQSQPNLDRLEPFYGIYIHELPPSLEKKNDRSKPL